MREVGDGFCSTPVLVGSKVVCVNRVRGRNARYVAGCVVAPHAFWSYNEKG